MNDKSRPADHHCPLSRRPPLSLLLALVMLLGMVACSGGEADPAAARITEPVRGVDDDGAQYVGVDSCLACHDNPDRVGAETYAATKSYLASRHAQPGTVGSDAPSSCLACHDSLGDGYLLAPWFADYDQPSPHMTAISCEVCHGAGAHHLTMIPEHPNAAPDYHACGRCHRDLPDGHPDAGRYGDGIYQKYEDSAHAGWSIGAAPCLRCHSDEGYRLYFAETRGMDGAELTAHLADVPWLVSVSRVQCRTCHEGHTGRLRGEATVEDVNDAEVVKFSRLFNLCTSCHQVFLTAEYDYDAEAYRYHLDTGQTPYHGELNELGHPVAGGQVIWDTHFATTDGHIAGYPIDPSSETACLGCHDPHAASKF